MSEVAERYVEAHGMFNFTSSVKNTFDSKYVHKPDVKQSYKGNEKQAHRYGQNKGNNQSSSFKCYNCGREGHKSYECKEARKQKSVAQGLQSVQENTEKVISEAVDKAVKEAFNKHSEASACLPVTEFDRNSVVDINLSEDTYETSVLNLSCTATVGKTESHPLGMPTCKGFILNSEVSVLRDTGCSKAVVRSELVSKEQFTGCEQTCILIDGTVRKFPIAKIVVDTPFYQGQTEALCMDNPVYDIIIGNIEGARDPNDPDKKWVPSCLNSRDNNLGNAVETRNMAKRKSQSTKPLKVISPLSKVSPSDFLKAQRNYPSIAHLWGKISEEQTGKYRFVEKNHVLARLCQDSVDKNKWNTRYVIPQCYRSDVMSLAHESLMSGHQGISRTFDRVASQFFWPGMYKDVTEYCKSCDICQRTIQKGKIPKIPLQKMPLIDEPLKRIAMDLVGPIYPASESGKRFILTVMDYATRYPEAVALANIDTEQLLRLC